MTILTSFIHTHTQPFKQQPQPQTHEQPHHKSTHHEQTKRKISGIRNRKTIA